MSSIAYRWHNNTFWLHHERLMFWEEENTLIASDLHLGKSGHFRKSGIAVPQQVMQNDLLRLFHVIQYYKPAQVVVAGDMFHSYANKELDWFLRWRNDFEWLRFVLVKGNHDVLKRKWYAEAGIDVVSKLKHQNLLFVHENCNEVNLADEGCAALVCGHIHPGIRLHTGARQKIQLPCFFFSPYECIMPAFGGFTGTFAVKPKQQDAVFAIASSQVMRVN